MAKKENNGYRKINGYKLKLSVKGFSILESLVATSLLLLLTLMITNLLLHVYQKLDTQKKYAYFLNSSQFLYWYFFNNITENIGVYNLENTNFATNNNYFKNNIDIKNIFALRSHKVKVIGYEEFKQEIINRNIHAGLSLKDIVKESDILQINFLSIDNRNNGQKNSILLGSKFYYIAQVSDQKYSLFVLVQNRQEELVKNVQKFNVNIVKHNNMNFYVFNIILNYQANKSQLSFIIKDSLLTY